MGRKRYHPSMLFNGKITNYGIFNILVVCVNNLLFKAYAYNSYRPYSAFATANFIIIFRLNNLERRIEKVA